MTPPFATAPTLAALPGIAHGFFGREGGVSGGIYASLNAGPGSRDDPAAVAENRRRIAAAFALPPERLLSAHQTHSARAAVVAAPWSGPRPEVDALVTRTPGLALAALAADCAPVLLADPQARVVAAVHAGWKGALGSSAQGGVLEAAVAAMIDLGAAPARIQAAIGPCIAQPSYEVGPEFEARFAAEDPEALACFRPGPGDRLLFDLKRYCAQRLARAGVTAIETSPQDTFVEEAGLFSHRRSVKRSEGDYGRNCSVVMLR